MHFSLYFGVKHFSDLYVTCGLRVFQQITNRRRLFFAYGQASLGKDYDNPLVDY